jgi:hypothetical protein
MPFSILSKTSEKALKTRLIALPYVFMGTVPMTALWGIGKAAYFHAIQMKSFNSYIPYYNYICIA